MSWQAFGARLEEAGLLGSQPLPARGAAGLPGFVTLLSGFGAWAGAAFLLAALSALSLGWLESATGRLVVGIAICVACAWWMRGRPANAFLAQFLTACGVAGTMLAASAAVDAPYSMRVLPLATAGAAAAMLAANPEPVSRLVMALLMVAALAVAAVQSALVPFACVLLAAASAALWLKQGSWSARGWGAWLLPLAVACTAALVALPVFTGPGDASWSRLLVDEEGVDFARTLAAWQGNWLAPVGLAIVLAASVLAIRRACGRGAGDGWQLGGHDAAIAAAATLLALACWNAPGILACLLAWMLGMAAARPALAWLGLAGLVAYLFQLYYSLETSLPAKGGSLLAVGLILLLLQYLLRRRPLPAADPHADRGRIEIRTPAWRPATSGAGGRDVAPGDEAGARGGWFQKGLAIVGAVIVLVAFNGSILQKEQLLRDGRVVRLALAPVDPRAFMTGDYMALDYAVAAQLNARLASAGDRTARDAVAVVALDPQGVAQLVRLQEGASPLQAGEVALKARLRQGRVRLGSDAFYFQEGTGRRYEQARYGEFRVGTGGDMLLVRLLDESLAAIPAN